LSDAAEEEEVKCDSFFLCLACPALRSTEIVTNSTSIDGTAQ